MRWFGIGFIMALLVGSCSTSSPSNTAPASSEVSTSTIVPASSTTTEVFELVAAESTVPPAPGSRGQLRFLRSPQAGFAPYDSIVVALLTELGYDVVDVLETTTSALEWSDRVQVRVALSDNPLRVLMAARADLFVSYWGVAESWMDYDFRSSKFESADGVAGDFVSTVGRADRDVIIRGFVISKAWADANAITTIGQLHDDRALLSALDRDGDGRGEILGVYEQDYTAPYHLAYNEWHGFINSWPAVPLQTSLADSWDEFIELSEAGQPAVGFLSAPSARHGEARLGDLTMWLSMETANVRTDNSTNPLLWDTPPESFIRMDDGTVGFQDLPRTICTQGPDGCQLGTPSLDLSALANTAWLAENPAVDELIDAIDLTRDEFSALEFAFEPLDYPDWRDYLEVWDAEIARSKKHASRWIAENRERVDAWLEMVQSS